MMKRTTETGEYTAGVTSVNKWDETSLPHGCNFS